MHGGKRGSDLRMVLSAVMFSPRGGSSHVARSLGRELPATGWEVTFVCGSRSDVPEGNGRSFYAGLDPWLVDFAPAIASPDPLAYEGDAHSAPMHPSYEDRPGAPDRVFATLGEAELENQVDSWAAVLEAAGADRHDVLHLHHLTPLNEAAVRVAPRVPIVGQLHGTELLMLEAIEAGPPASWRCAGAWAQRLRDWAGRCERLLVAPAGVERARRLLGVPLEKLVLTPNGVDLNSFRPRDVDRRAHWRRHLGAERGGGGAPAAAGGADLESLATGVVLMYVGRFTAVKRLSLLIGSFARAEGDFTRPAALVLVGGHPGEWEGEHPAQAITRTGAAGVHLAGWHSHSELPSFYNAADVVVLTSSREQFGQALVEGMACGLPALATRSPGPESIVADGETGWLVPPDDEDALVSALAGVVNDEPERRRRGRAAQRATAHRYGWNRIAAGVAAVLDEAAAT